MREDGDLRARIEARVAARRQATGRPTPGLNGRTPPRPSGGPDEEPEDTVTAEDTASAENTGAEDIGPDNGRPRPGPGVRRPKPAPSGDARPAPAPNPPHSRPNDSDAQQEPSATRPKPPDTRLEPSGSQQDSTSESAPRSPDISRFLAASEPQSDDHSGEQDEQKRSASAQNTRKALRVLLRIAVIVGIAVGAALLLRTYVVAPYYIPSESMEPTLHGCTGCDDDHVLVDKISYRLHDPHQSDIIVFTRPPAAQTTDHVLIKRVIGLPGDRVALRHGDVYINGKRLKEPYVRKACGPHPTRPETGQSRWQVPQGDLFVLGDNRCDSMDSREFGPIKESSVVGRAFAIIWPLGRIGLL